MSFNLFGVRIEVRFSFFAALTLFSLTDKTGLAELSILVCLLHEGCHLAAFFLLRLPLKSVVFEASGIRIVRSGIFISGLSEVIIQLAGSFGNFVFGGIFLSALGKNAFSFLNFAVGIFNLLPMKTLDGGKLLKLFLSAFFREGTAEKIAVFIDGIFLFAFILSAALMIINRRANVTLLIFVLYLLSDALIKKLESA